MQGLKEKTNIRILLNNSIESSYWVGFILADGYISEKDIELALLYSRWWTEEEEK